jgi:hypothetical protein
MSLIMREAALVLCVSLPIFALPDAANAQAGRTKRLTIEEAKRIIADQTRDPEAVKFRKVRVGKDGFVCGEFNAKNAYGGYIDYRLFYVAGPDDDDGNWEGKEASATRNGEFNAKLDSLNSTLIVHAFTTKCASNAPESR